MDIGFAKRRAGHIAFPKSTETQVWNQSAIELLALKHTKTHTFQSLTLVQLAWAIFHPCTFMLYSVESGRGYGSPVHL